MQKVPLRLLACGILFTSLLISSCAKKVDIIQPINGYYTADAVDSLNLIAHWSFDGDCLESKSQASPINLRNIAFGPSFKGQCLALTDGFVEYAPITRLAPSNLARAFTITAWVLVKNNSTYGSNIFSLANKSTLINGNGNITFSVGTDLADVKNLVLFPEAKVDFKRDTTSLEYYAYTDPGDTLNPDSKNEIVYNGGTWCQLAMRFNSNDSGLTTLEIIANGNIVSTPAARYLLYKNLPVGALNFITPANILIGAYPTTDLQYNAPKQPYMANFNGAIDEIRVYNKALPLADIRTLYQLEQLGR